MTLQKASTYFHELRLRYAASSRNKIEDDGLVASVLSHLLPFLLSKNHIMNSNGNLIYKSSYHII
jgi:hypothetical protein